MSDAVMPSPRPQPGNPLDCGEPSESALELEYQAQAQGVVGAVPPGGSETNEPLPLPNECPDVGVTPGGSGEAAVIRRETSI